MSIRLKKLGLENYCGYKGEILFDFTKENGEIKNFCAFYGPNGYGKSKLTKAIELVCNAKRLQNFGSKELFRKLIFNKNYLQGYETLKTADNTLMTLRGLFDVDGKEKIVEINSNDGVVCNELPSKAEGHCMYLDADHPMNMNKFQLHSDMSKVFLDIAESVYEFKCELGETLAQREKHMKETVAQLTSRVYGLDVSVGASDLSIASEEDFHTDFSIYKEYLDATIHYKTMSDGEKKIATLLRQICDPNYIKTVDIIVIDNVEMHIYFKRHLTLVNKLMSHFPDKQFFVTTHSGILVEKLPKDMLFDIEEKFK